MTWELSNKPNGRRDERNSRKITRMKMKQTKKPCSRNEVEETTYN